MEVIAGKNVFITKLVMIRLIVETIYHYCVLIKLVSLKFSQLKEDMLH